MVLQGCEQGLETEPSPDVGFRDACGKPDDPACRAYSHPLAAASTIDGPLPFLEALGPDVAHRYTVLDTVGEIDTENGEIESIRESGIHNAIVVPLQKEAKPHPKAAAVPEASPVAPDLAARLQDAGPNDEFVVEVSLPREQRDSLTTQVLASVARGEIKTVEDLENKRSSVLAERRVKISAATIGMAIHAWNAGATAVARCENLHCLRVRGAKGMIAALANKPGVARIDEAPEMYEEHWTDGRVMSRAAQIDQLVEVSPYYDGEGSSAGSGDDLYVAVIESGTVLQTHPGFRDGTTSYDRVRDNMYCTSSSCTTNTCTVNCATDHAAKVAGILLGDLTDGQDSNYPSSNERKMRSGYAREAWMHVYDLGVGGLSTALDHVNGQATYRPIAVNLSLGSTGDDPNCLGQNATSRTVNELYEDGILVFKSAGNEGLGSGMPPACTVTSPGSAIGAFTVANADTNNSTYADEVDLRGMPIASSSSVGGDPSSNRTIIDLAAWGGRALGYWTVDSPQEDAWYENVVAYHWADTGTSFSAPQVTGAAVDIVDFWKQEVSSAIDDPGVLFALLLTMGDRKGEGGYLSSDFDRRWGAGRLRTRKFDGPGMDSSWQVRAGWTCVGDGETVRLQVYNRVCGSTCPPPFPYNVDQLKAVIWWYDPRHELGQGLADIDLKIRDENLSTVAHSWSSTDNKERIFLDGIANEHYWLDIDGWDVSGATPDPLCANAQDTIRVHYAWFWEDDARNDSDGPTWNSSSGIGVAKEDYTP